MANGIRGNIIRSRTGSCNREDRPSAKRQMAQARFGLFRPLIAESITEFREKLEPAQKSIDVYLSGRKRASQRASVESRSWLGVTYLSPHNSAEALRNNELDMFAGRRVAKVLSANRVIAKTINVPVNGFEWYGHGDKKLGAVIRPFGSNDSDHVKKMKLLEEIGPKPWTKEQAASEKAKRFEHLAELSAELEEVQSEQVATFHKDVRAIRQVVDKSAEVLTPQVFVPDYVPILDYDSPCHESVTQAHKEDIIEIMNDHFDFKEQPLTLTLGQLVAENERPQFN